MSNRSVKKIPIDKAIPGMVIATDVITNTGTTLVSENTLLNKRNITKLKLYGVENIEIIKDGKADLETEDLVISANTEIEALSKPEDLSPKDMPIPDISKPKATYIDIEALNKFKANHKYQEESLKHKMLDISEGGKIEMLELYSISDELIEAINNKSELFSFLNNLQSFDDYTYTHCINVSLVSYTLGQWLGYDSEELQHISVAGLLHDIGKTQVDIDILSKERDLTPEEFGEVKKHSVYGFRIVENQNIPNNVKMAILMHHERIDGSGYPMGAKGDDINEYAKIIAIADIYDAMTSERPYRNKYCPFSVIETFEKDYLGKLDTKFLMTFLNNIAYCYLDSWVELSTGEKGQIIFVNSNKPSRPIVKVDNVLVDLSKEKSTHIVKIL